MTPERVSDRESVETRAILDQRIGNLACSGDCIIGTFAHTIQVITNSPLDEAGNQAALAQQITRLDLAVTEALNPIPDRISNDESAKNEYQDITDQHIASLVDAITLEFEHIEEIDPRQIDHLLSDTISPATINMIKNPYIKEGAYINVILAVATHLPGKLEDKKTKTQPYLDSYVQILEEFEGENANANRASARINLALLSSICNLGDEAVISHLNLAYESTIAAEVPVSFRGGGKEIAFLMKRAETPEGSIEITGILSKIRILPRSKAEDIPPHRIQFLEKFGELLMLENTGVHRDSQPVLTRRQQLKRDVYEELKGMSPEDHKAMFVPELKSMDDYIESFKIIRFLTESIYGGGPDTEVESPDLMAILLDLKKVFPDGEFGMQEDQDGSLRQFELDLRSSNQDKRLFIYNMVESISDDPLIKCYLTLGIASAPNIDPYSRKVFFMQANYLREKALRRISKKERRIMQKQMTDIMSR